MEDASIPCWGIAQQRRLWTCTSTAGLWVTLAPLVVPQALQDGVGLPTLVEMFCTEGYNKLAKLHYLGPLLSNLTQLPEARAELLSPDR